MATLSEASLMGQASVDRDQFVGFSASHPAASSMRRLLPWCLPPSGMPLTAYGPRAVAVVPVEATEAREVAGALGEATIR